MPPSLRVALCAAVVAATAAPAVAQDDVPQDTVAAADEPDSLTADETGFRLPDPLPPDPRMTWLGDTLPEQPRMPQFAELPEIYPDSLIDPYVLDRPGASPAWVLSGDQLTGRGAFTLLDILESEVLIAPVDLGGPGAPSFLMTGSGTFTNLQVFVDGVPMGTPFAAAWDLRQIPVEGIARIAFYPGPQSAAWGGEATGGVLSITTRRALAPTARSALSFILGSFDAEGFSGNFGRRLASRGEVFVASNFDASDGFVRAGDFTRNQIVFRAGWQFDGPHRLEFSQISDGLSGRASRNNVTDEEDQDRSTSHLFYRGAAGPVSLRGHYWSESLELQSNLLLAEQPGLIGTSDETGLRGTASFRIGPVEAWGEAMREESETFSDHPAFRSPAGGSLLDDPDDPEAPRLENPRTRVEWAGGAGWSSLDGRLAGNLAVRRLDYGDAADAGTAWRAEGVYRPAPAWTVRASAGRGVRAADLIGQATLTALGSGEIRPGRDADPANLEEWSEVRGEVTWERPGWRARVGAWRSTGDETFLWLSPSAWNRFDPGAPDARLGTLGLNTFDVVDLEMTGVELEAAMPLPYGAKGVFLWRSVDATEEITGEELPYLPSHQGLGQIRWARRMFPSRDLLVETRISGRFAAERETLSETTLPSYFLLDLLVQATVINFTVYVSFKNLAGRAYRTEESFFLPQTEGYFGIFWRFRN